MLKALNWLMVARDNYGSQSAVITLSDEDRARIAAGQDWIKIAFVDVEVKPTGPLADV